MDPAEAFSEETKKPLAPEDWILLEEIIGHYSRDAFRRAGYQAQPNVGSVFDNAKAVCAECGKLAALQEKVKYQGMKAGAEAAPF